MELGQRLRQARLSAGLSQRQLCGEVITRNMLSQIENGSARPSMDTLAYLATRLGKPISYFLEEASLVSSNAECMAQARTAYAQGCYEEAVEALESYTPEDEIFEDEFGLLKNLLLLAQAEKAMDENRPILACQLLETAANPQTCYCLPELEQRRLYLLAQVSVEPVSLPVDDRPLLIRAETALKDGDIHRCMVLLEACEDHSQPRWHYLQAEAAFQQEDYAKAVRHYHGAEQAFPEKCDPKLEACYRALEDYKKAYEYACKQRFSQKG